MPQPINGNIDPHVLRKPRLTPSTEFPQSTDREYEDWRTCILADARSLVNSIDTWKPSTTYNLGVGSSSKASQQQVFTFVKDDVPDGDKWFARQSFHTDISYDSFKRGLFYNHSLNEQQYIPEIKSAQQLSTVVDDEIEIWQISYALPFPVHDRFFTLIIFTIEEPSDDSFLVISLPLKSHSAEEATRDRRAFYESVERVTRHSGRVEWRMCTRSHPGGLIPQYFANVNMPKTIAKDVVRFISWNRSKKWG